MKWLKAIGVAVLITLGVFVFVLVIPVVVVQFFGDGVFTVFALLGYVFVLMVSALAFRIKEVL